MDNIKELFLKYESRKNTNDENNFNSFVRKDFDGIITEYDMLTPQAFYAGYMAYHNESSKQPSKVWFGFDIEDDLFFINYEGFTFSCGAITLSKAEYENLFNLLKTFKKRLKSI
jgi:hypothetical protein